MDILNTILVMWKCASCWFFHIRVEDGSAYILIYPRRQGGILELECIDIFCHKIGSVDVCFRHVNDIIVVYTF